jgi:hypothetical protein
MSYDWKPKPGHKPAAPEKMPDDSVSAGYTCPPNVSFAKDIAPLFRINPNSIPHMLQVSKAHQPPLVPPIDLSNYNDVKHWAGSIYNQVKSGSMPIGGPKWTTDQVSLFLCWAQQGFKP